MSPSKISFCLVWLVFAGCIHAQPATTYLQKLRTVHSAKEFEQITAGKVKIQRNLDPQQQIALRLAIMRWPNTDFTVIAVQSPTVTWVGTKNGAIRISGEEKKLEYFAGLRWLPDDQVTGIGFDDNSTWIETPKGFSRIEYKPMTLADKSKIFVERIQTRHNRWGQTADSYLRVAGDVSSNAMVSNDNDGMWTAIYVAAEAFRYKVTGEKDARENARQGMKALLRLESITGIPGFPARSIIKVGVDQQPGDGEWHDTADKKWRWKGDTSSDEIVGHYFVFPIYYDLLADEDEKPIVRGMIERITNHILDHNYQLVDTDGKHTLWGYWGPDEIWKDPDETGLRALHILSHLAVAMHMTENLEYQKKFRAAYDNLINNEKYHLLMRNQKINVPGIINHSDDELAFLSYYPLLSYEKDPELLEVYRHSLQRSWQVERAERNPLWNFIYAAGSGAKEFDKAESLRTLHEIPMDMIEWSVRNSHRLDLPMDPLNDRQGSRQALIVLPYDELPISKWNGNPYNLDGGNGGHAEDDGAYFLLPYWMGRFHKFIDQ